MTQWILTCYDQSQYTLPTPISWQLEYGLGSPCDSFQFCCPWTAGQETILATAVRLMVKEAGEIVFCGVVDECECSWSERGVTLKVMGRGMQAILLDNEAAGTDYGVATLEDILRRYVTPYGISLAEKVQLPSVSGFSVKTGSSCWQVLYQFARYHAAVTPRFDRQGRLLLSAWNDKELKQLDDSAPITRLMRRYQRYGVLSQMKVVDRVTHASQTVVNEDFHAKGGCCSSVLTMPRNTSYQSMRYQAQFQLDQSKAELDRVEITVAKAFFAWPGDLLAINRSAWGGNATYRVLESTVRLDDEGCQTTLILGDPDTVL